MLKLLKWVYNLGVKHERERVRSLLTKFANTYYDDMNIIAGFDNPPKERQEKLLKDIGIRASAMVIIKKLLFGEEVCRYETSKAELDKD